LMTSMSSNGKRKIFFQQQMLMMKQEVLVIRPYRAYLELIFRPLLDNHLLPLF